MRDQFQKLRIHSVTSWLLRNMMLMTIGGMALTAILLTVALWRSGSRFFETINGVFNMPQPQPEVDVRTLVVSKVRGVSELTTSVFSMEAVVPARQDRNLAGYTVGTTTLLYIAYGEVRAGVDLGELKPDDVQVVDNNIQLQLPPPRMLDSKIDVHRSQIYDYDRGFLGLGPDVGPQLHILAQQETLRKITAAACKDGLLEKANDRAQLVVTKLLNTSGYKQVVVDIQAPAPGTCSDTVVISNK
ncbi:MAG: DUF4230 domain-containing protein [Symploca sp. SIO3C6]|uniref:DUF4230 domain-containing protein n=1 Tax=Symploca sp. SIO1C4 TaxID=2607765 RepID=A0A6B3NAN4_9CYAN|nr:DUF4230 domain-containing protein [Symploca sp. SIO3C6]NER27652.1 DUF4230 domain-containing protein [Symploca sp. SIO1C4]NET03897.1 DUF4230 domain-containing protein [Symploca sp. SIO2B6]NET49863.1 DUF4230 domain-containing protein [Merismopedia sp. SIO2A8]